MPEVSEREGVRTWKTFELTSTQTTVSVPITEKDIPNLFVAVTLLKGRTKDGIEDESDPGKPAFRLGYTALSVVDARRFIQNIFRAAQLRGPYDQTLQTALGRATAHQLSRAG